MLKFHLTSKRIVRLARLGESGIETDFLSPEDKRECENKTVTINQKVQTLSLYDVLCVNI